MHNFAERYFLRVILGIWMLVAVAILFLARDVVATWEMGDPDDQMRLLQVRDWVAGQSWWDITQYRMNAPDGGDMHWSRLVDVPLALVIVAATPFLGQATAEQLAATAVPLMTLAAAMFFYALGARRLVGPLTATVATALILTFTSFVVQMVPMRIDHHGWQLVCFLAALWALFNRQGSLRSAAVLGLSCALWIEISVEGLPFVALILGVSGLGWIVPSMASSRERNNQFPIALLWTWIGTFTLFCITESWGSPNFCDALSPVHIAALGAMATIIMAGTLLQRAGPSIGTTFLRFGICCAAATVGLATLFAMAPQCAGDAFSSLDPLVREYWFNRVPEGLPLWAGPLDVAVQAYAYMVAGVIALAYLSLHNKQLTKSDKLRLLLLYAGAWAIGVFVSRTSVYATSVANLLLAAMVVDIFISSERRRSLLARIGMRVFALLLAMPILSAQALINRVNAVEARADPVSDMLNHKFQKQLMACQKSSAVAALSELPSAAIMAGLDTNPAILLFTRHSVVASGHHRNTAAMSDVMRTFTGKTDQAARIIIARNIRFVVICEGSYELLLYARKAPEGMLARLRAGNVPNWLQRKSDIGPFQIFEVNHAMLPPEILPS